MLHNQSKTLNCIINEATIGINLHQRIKHNIRLIDTSSFNNGSKDGGGRVLPFARDYEVEERLGFWARSVVAEVLGHCVVRVEGVTEGGLRREPVKEG